MGRLAYERSIEYRYTGLQASGFLRVKGGNEQSSGKGKWPQQSTACNVNSSSLCGEGIPSL